MVDCEKCCQPITGEVHRTVPGGFICGACHDTDPKCPGCDRSCPPHYLYEDGLCGGCTHCQ